MARKETLVQLDDQMVTQLDEWAERLGVSRSELIRRGVASLLQALDWEQADRELAEAYRRLPQDPLLMENLFRISAETLPQW